MLRSRRVSWTEDTEPTEACGDGHAFLACLLRRGALCWSARGIYKMIRRLGLDKTDAPTDSDESTDHGR